MAEPMKSVSINSKVKANTEAILRGPNVIGNAAVQMSLAAQPFDFNSFKYEEEKKEVNTNAKLTLDQFTRKVHSKHDLLYALGIKGKQVSNFNRFSSIVGQMFLPEQRYCTMDYLRSILNGSKRVFKNVEVRKVKVPRYR